MSGERDTCSGRAGQERGLHRSAPSRQNRGRRLFFVVVSVVLTVVLLTALFVFVALPALGCPKTSATAPTGSVSEYCFAPFTGGSHSLGGIVSGPDGNLWFTEKAHIGRITPAGAITEFALPTSKSMLGASMPGALVAGPDGNLWFGEEFGSRIGRITPSGQITLFSLPDSTAGVRSMAPGPGRAVWFVQVYPIDLLSQFLWGTKIGRITV